MRRLLDGKVMYDEDSPEEIALARRMERIAAFALKTLAWVLPLVLILWFGPEYGWRDVIEDIRRERWDLLPLVLFMIAIALVGRWRRRKHDDD